MPARPPERQSAYHMFYVLLPDQRRSATRCSARLRERGVQATFHYVPLHSSDAGRMFAARETECPVTIDISGRLLRLPFYNNLSAGRRRPRRRRPSSSRVAVDA